MKRKLALILLLCSLSANLFLGFALTSSAAACKERLFYSTIDAQGWFITFHDCVQNGYSTEEARIRAVAALESMTQLIAVVEKNNTYASTLRFFVSMLVTHPESFEPHLAEIIAVLELLAKTPRASDAYERIDRMLDGFRG